MKKRLYALALFLCLLLTGCTKTPYSGETNAEITLPEPSLEPVTMILGEQMASKPRSVTFYYVSGDGTSFSTITRSVNVASEENIYKETVNILLNSGSSSDRVSFVPADTQVLDVEFACGIATVNLSLGAHQVQSEQEYLMLQSTIVNTLLSLEEVRGVNVLINDRAVSIADLPIGAHTASITGIAPAYAQLSAERDYFYESETGTITRNAVLYFPDSHGEWFVPELREVTLDSNDYASVLIHALRDGPAENAEAISPIPEDANLLTDIPFVEVTSTGERILCLTFSTTLRNYLSFSGIEEWQMLGSLALTICSFTPDIDAVQICIDNEPVSTCMIDDQEIGFEGGLIHRNVFSPYIGNTVTLWLPAEGNTLRSSVCAISMDRATSPQSRMRALFENILTGSGSASFFPEGVYYTDILGISVEKDIAYVNLSANFYRQSQALDAAAERGVIYAIVNTLCEMDNISGVRFFIEGITAETLSGSIYLKGILLPNPGLVATEATAVPEITATP